MSFGNWKVPGYVPFSASNVLCGLEDHLPL